MPLDYHLERRLRLNVSPEHSRLYGWAINEIDQKGKVGSDQIPWAYSFVFKAKSCALIASSEFGRDYGKDQPSPHRLKDNRVIRAQLRPSVFGDEDDFRRHRPRFSMFGTDRVIEDFTLDIRPSNAHGREEDEGCRVWGGVSYSSEDGDFRQQTEPDVIVFTLTLTPEAFARYAAMIAQQAVSEVSFRVRSVQGFYSDWSPTISASHVKVLAAGEAQPVEPGSEGIAPPRLGQVEEAEVTFVRRLVFEKKPGPEDEADDAIEMETLVGTQAQGSAVADPKLLKAIRSLKRAVWLVAVLLVAILLNLLSR